MGYTATGIGKRKAVEGQWKGSGKLQREPFLTTESDVLNEGWESDSSVTKFLM